MKTWNAIFRDTLSNLGKSKSGVTKIKSNKEAINIEILSFGNTDKFKMKKLNLEGRGAHTIDAIVQYRGLDIGIEFTTADVVKKMDQEKNLTLAKKVACTILNQEKIGFLLDEIWFVSPRPEIFKDHVLVKEEALGYLKKYGKDFKEDVYAFERTCRKLKYMHMSVEQFNVLIDNEFSFPKSIHKKIVNYAKDNVKDIEEVVL